MSLKSSKFAEINHRKYCVYCCQSMKSDVEYDEYTPYYSDYCDCELAELERKMYSEINEVKKKYSKLLIRNDKGLEDLDYSIKLKELNDQHKTKLNIIKYNSLR